MFAHMRYSSFSFFCFYICLGTFGFVLEMPGGDSEVHAVHTQTMWRHRITVRTVCISVLLCDVLITLIYFFPQAHGSHWHFSSHLSFVTIFDFLASLASSLSSFLPSFFPSYLLSFFSSFLPSFLPSLLHTYLPIFFLKFLTFLPSSLLLSPLLILTPFPLSLSLFVLYLCGPVPFFFQISVFLSAILCLRVGKIHPKLAWCISVRSLYWNFLAKDLLVFVWINRTYLHYQSMFHLSLVRQNQNQNQNYLNCL